RLTGPARERVDGERDASSAGGSVRKTYHRDARAVANGNRDTFDADRSRILDGVDAQAMRSVGQPLGVELERGRWRERLVRDGFVVDEDLDSHRPRASGASSISSRRIRRLM